MRINRDLRSALVKRFGKQVQAAREMGIRENRLSYIVRGRTEPSAREREALEGALGRATVWKLLKNNSRKERNDG